jgi:intracellular multiplication protein IcmK
MGHVTTMNFIDITGERWPIQQITWAGDFDIVESSGEEGSNMLRITPNSQYARGNISIQMLKLDTPIVMIIETNRDTVHYRFDAVIPEVGPFAKTPLVEKGITLTAGRQDVASILQGIVPDSAVKLNVSGVDGRTSAYTYNGMMYLRTPLTLLSPGWSGSVSSADGMRVYELQSTPIVLLSNGGKMVRAQISDREAIINEQ